MDDPRDTSPEAREQQLAAYRRMDGPTRVALALQMSDEAMEIARAGERHRREGAPPAAEDPVAPTTK